MRVPLWTTQSRQIWHETSMRKPFTTRTRFIQLNPSSYLGYKLKHGALYGAHRYDEAMEAFNTMLLKSDDAPYEQIQSKPGPLVRQREIMNAFSRAVSAVCQFL
ncbi:hypothetical protein DFH29DRAFT_539718 [Suillus ampliporus]|nr:hypothetical protein DFH29DRAFT_539718 [Suillus ampliporus]